MIRRQVVPALLMAAVLTVGLGLVYPLAVTAIAQVTMGDRADGSLVEVDGQVVGSRLIGQNFSRPDYFHPRPSAAGADGYDGLASAGSNLGPSNPELLDSVKERVAAFRDENGLDPTVEVPVDAVTASGSGLDPHISVANAKLQVERVAEARKMNAADLVSLVDEHTDDRSFGFLGQPGVNVLELNLALDSAS